MANLIISGPIDDKAVRKVAKYLSANTEDTTVIINSQGGDEHCGRAIAGLLMDARARNQKISTMGFGDVHSAAVLVFAAGRTRSLSRFASIMLHESSAETEGSASAIKKQAKQMEREEQFWCDALQELTGTESKVWMKLHSDETFLQPNEALKLNLATEVI